ncbi:hypothetical protein EDB83DRAFT_2229541 [Lactarius deliciosus]|nr:hypothetical protein EDB83DRAFT_2229541 [Lactarius deliciosus]
MAYPKLFPLISPLKPPLHPTFLSICLDCRDEASTCFTFLDCFVVLQSHYHVQTFANNKGGDPSRIGAAACPLMEGMEQLNTIIGFKDSGTGIACELRAWQCTPKIHAPSGTSSPLSVTSQVGVTSFRYQRRSAMSSSNSTSGQTRRTCSAGS